MLPSTRRSWIPWLLAGALGAALDAHAATGFPLLLFEPDSRAAARGESALADCRGLEGFHQNPAALAGLEGEALGLLYVDHLQDLQVLSTSWGTDRVPDWRLGLSLLHLDYGDLEGLDEQGQSTGSFDAGATLLLAGVARQLPDVWGGQLEAGLQAGYAGTSVDDASASALLGNAGLNWRRGQLSLGASARNVGVVLSSLGESQDRLPRSLEAGTAWTLAHLPFTWSLAWQSIRERDPFFKLGGEFRVARRWRLGLGYQVERGDDRLGGVSGEGSRGFSAGVGGSLPHGFELGWSWSSYGELGSLNRLALVWHYKP